MKRIFITLAAFLLLFTTTIALAAHTPAATPPSYRITFLGAETSVGASVSAPSLNQDGTAVGNYITPNQKHRGWVWDAQAGQRVYLPLPPFATDAEVADVNNNALILGSVWNATSGKRLALWTPGAEGYVFNALCNNEVIEGIALNDNNVIIGHRTIGGSQQIGIRYVPGVGCQDLTELGFNALPYAINEENWIVGGTQLLMGSQVENLGNAPGYPFTELRAINDAHGIAGNASDGVNERLAHLFNQTEWSLIGPEAAIAQIQGLNNNQYFVGVGETLESSDPGGIQGWYCLTCTMTVSSYLVHVDDLLINQFSDYSITLTSDINDARQMVGRAYNSATMQYDAVLLTPVGQCAQNCLRAQAINLFPYTVGGNQLVIARVTVRYEQGASVPNAAVQGAWQRPDGSIQVVNGTTNNNGYVFLFIPYAGPGNYSLNVLNITRGPNTHFDPLNSNQLMNTITLP